LWIKNRAGKKASEKREKDAGNHYERPKGAEQDVAEGHYNNITAR
jgi:hypothetical protein